MFGFMQLYTKAMKLWYKLEMGHHAAAFSYYAPFALIPLILVSVGVSGYIFGIPFVKNIFLGWGTVFGPDLGALLDVAVQNLDIQVHTYEIPFVATFFFLVITVFAFNVLGSGFLRVWGTAETGFKPWLWQTLRSAVFVVILQFYIIFILIIEGLWAEVPVQYMSVFPTLIWFFSISLLFFLLFRFLTKGAPSIVGCLVGGVTTGLLFLTAKNIVGVYLAAKPVLTIFGAAGLILVLLVWVYVLAVIIYYGAIVAHLYDVRKRKV